MYVSFFAARAEVIIAHLVPHLVCPATCCSTFLSSQIAQTQLGSGEEKRKHAGAAKEAGNWSAAREPCGAGAPACPISGGLCCYVHPYSASFVGENVLHGEAGSVPPVGHFGVGHGRPPGP